MPPVSITVAVTADTMDQAQRDIRAAIDSDSPEPPYAPPPEPPDPLPEPDWTPPEPPPEPSVQPGSSGRVLVVGPGGHAATITQAMAQAEDGDTIRVNAGVPREPFEVTKILRVVAENVSWDFRDFPSDQLAGHGRAAIVPASSACVIEGFEISGVGLDQRWAGLIAGIRNEASGWLTVSNCLIHDCQNGITSPSHNAMIEVIDTRLWRNGLNWTDADGVQHGGVGHTHNLYVNDINTLTLRNVVATAPTDGHAVKTRGHCLVVQGGVFDSERGRCFDISDGGQFTITDAVLMNPASGNAILLGYAVESSAAGVSNDNRLDRCTLYLLRHNNAVHTEAGLITFTDCTWHGHRLGVTGAGLVAGLPA